MRFLKYFKVNKTRYTIYFPDERKPEIGYIYNWLIFSYHVKDKL